MTASNGSDHAGFIKSDGSLWMWGKNNSGQLGTGAAGDFVETPVRIMVGVQAVSCGNGYTLILKYDGTLWGCGRTSCLGLGTNENAAAPVKLMDNVAAIQAHSDCAGALKKDGRTVAELKSWIDYDGRVIPFDRGYRKLLHLGGDGEGLRLQGVIRLPGELEPGSYVMDFFTVPGLDCFFARCSVQYPYTKEDHEISTQASNLGRYSDPRWRQTAPFEWTLKLSDQARVTKRNFMDDLSFYPLSDFWRAFPQNENISSINHQLTGGVLSVSDEKGGLLLSHARQVLGSMAHCPLRLQSLGTVRQLSLNPFGSYFGPQRYYPSRGNGSSKELYLAAAPQARPLAPAYNGAWEQSVQALFPMDGLSPDDETLRQALAIADGAVALDCDGPFRPFEGDNVKLHQAVGNRVDPKELKSVSFAQQIGGSLPMLGLVKRYTENLNRAQKQMRKSEKEMKGR